MLARARFESPEQLPDGAPALTVLMPANRESASLRRLLPSLLGALATISSDVEVIVIDTRDRFDDTSEVCGRFGVRHLRQHGTGYGDAVRTGIEAAHGRYVLFMDADGSHDPRSIVALWRQRHNFEIVIGSRYVAGGRTENGALLVAMSRIVCLTFRAIFPVAVKDVSTSFRLYDATVLKALTLRARDYDILQEILLEAIAGTAGARITEIPITFYRRTNGSSKRRPFSLCFGYLTTFLRLRCRSDPALKTGHKGRPALL